MLPAKTSNMAAHQKEERFPFPFRVSSWVAPLFFILSTVRVTASSLYLLIVCLERSRRRQCQRVIIVCMGAGVGGSRKVTSVDILPYACARKCVLLALHAAKDGGLP